MTVSRLIEMNKNNSTRVWFDFIDYANRLFNQNNKDVWENPVTFLSVYSQGQSMLGSDVISISLMPFYTHWLEENQHICADLNGKKLKQVLKKMLSLQEPKKKVEEVLKGLQHLYEGKWPLVLFLASPCAWLDVAGKFSGDRKQVIDKCLIDTAAMYLADFIRNFSEVGLSTVIIEENSNSKLLTNEIKELYQPILNVAAHYQWEIGYVTSTTDNLECIDIISKEKETIGQVRTIQTVDTVWWFSNSSTNIMAEKDIIFGRIPIDANPELVLAKLKEIKKM